MINIIPQSEVKLLRIPLEKDEEHTLSFNNVNEQTNYFLNNVFKSYSDFTYIREQQALVVPENYDTICTCTYLMYRNNGFNNKYFYAFITKMEYVSENSTRIYFEIDSLQTWFFQLEMNQVFIEREHVSDDTIGKHTVPENVELGDYVSEERTLGESVSFAYLYRKQGESAVLRNKYIVVGTSNPLYMFPITGGNRVYNGIYSGLYYYIFPTGGDVDTFITYQNSHYSNDPTTCIFMVPEQFFTGSFTQYTLDGKTANLKELPYSTQQTLLQNAYVNKTNKLGNNYVPTNNKLLTWPYKYFIVNNNSGSANDFKYEDFSNANQCDFNIEGALTVGCSIKAIPMNYKNETKNNLYSIDSGKLPTCSWTNDAFTNWLTGNAVNMGLNATTSVATIIGGAGLIATGGGAGVGIGMITSGVTGVANQIAQIYEHSKIPNTAHGGINQGDYNYADSLTFTIHKRVIKEEFARIIDSYFNKYGYKVNMVKLPEIYSRRNFNYIKTIDCNFKGNIPQEDLEKIKNIFNKGITFWHNPQNFLNYSVNNDII